MAARYSFVLVAWTTARNSSATAVPDWSIVPVQDVDGNTYLVPGQNRKVRWGAKKYQVEILACGGKRIVNFESKMSYIGTQSLQLHDPFRHNTILVLTYYLAIE